MSSSAIQAGFTIKFGDIIDDPTKEISKIQAKAYTLKPQIEEFENSIKEKLGRSNVPFIFVELPEYFPVEKVPFFSQIWEEGQNNQNESINKKVNKQNKSFYPVYLKDPDQEISLFIKKLNKVFSQINTTKKELFAQVEFYDIGKRISQIKTENKPLTPLLILFDNCYARGWMDLSKEFWEMFTTLANSISPKFANSPVMAVLPLMERVSLDLTFDSVNNLDESITGSFQGCADEKLYKMAKEKKDKMRVYISFEKLGYLQMSIDLQILAVAQLG